MAVETQEDRAIESLRTFDISQLKASLFGNLTNWETDDNDPSRLLLRHKKYDTDDTQYFVQIDKAIDPKKDSTRFAIHSGGGLLFFDLKYLRTFSVGKRGIGLPGEQEIIRFNAVNKASVEIRNDGSVWQKTKNSRASFIPLFDNPDNTKTS